jgi:hypothetical protein
MMRRIVDATIPVLCLVGTVPVFARVIDVPQSMRESFGVGAGILWCIICGSAMALISAGIVLRQSHPSLSFRLEFPALIVAGTTSGIYGVVLFGVSGWRGWTAAWFIWAIGAHFTARYVEAARARRTASRADG